MSLEHIDDNGKILDTSIPAIDELAALGQRFVCWTWLQRGNGPPTKPPICAATGGMAASDKPNTWVDLGTAQAAAAKHGYPGVGFVFNGDGLVGVDFDGCRDPETGEIATWAWRFIRGLRSYTEVSPSGTGVKTYCRADPLPVLQANKRVITETDGFGGKAAQVEIFTTTRYFCLTGQIIEGVPDEIVDATAEVEKIVAWISKDRPQQAVGRPGELPGFLIDLLTYDAKLKDAWENGTKLGDGADTTASGKDASLATYLRGRYNLPGQDIEAVLRLHPHGQIGGGKLKGRAAGDRIENILGFIPLIKAGGALVRNGNGATHYGLVVAPEMVTAPLVAQRMDELDGKPVPTLRYDVAGWVPKGKAVLLAGAGGSGKTTLACQIGAARAIGANFLGLEVERGTTMAFLCEDDEDDAHRMLARHAEHFGQPLREFTGFHYLARVGQENALVARSNKGVIQPTPLYHLYQQMICDLKIDLQIIDNCRHVAFINENDGAEVTAAWSFIHGLMASTGGTTILIGHTPKNKSSEFSGNAAWENVARVRLFLGPHEAVINKDKAIDGIPDERVDENDPRRVLSRGKANANGKARLDVVWDHGAFRLEQPETGYGDKLAREMRRGEACQVFLDALDVLTSQQRSMSASSKASGNYAPKLIRDAGLSKGFSASELTDAMQQLFTEGRIKASMPLPWKDKAYRPATGISRAV